MNCDCVKRMSYSLSTLNLKTSLMWSLPFRSSWKAASPERKREGERESQSASSPQCFTQSLVFTISLRSCTFIVRFRGVTKFCGDVFIVIEIKRGRGHGAAGPAVVTALLFHHKGHGQQLSIREKVYKLFCREVKLEKTNVSLIVGILVWS